MRGSAIVRCAVATGVNRFGEATADCCWAGVDRGATGLFVVQAARTTSARAANRFMWTPNAKKVPECEGRRAEARRHTTDRANLESWSFRQKKAPVRIPERGR